MDVLELVSSSSNSYSGSNSLDGVRVAGIAGVSS